ncbi:helix-turn-helix domain-containing protein [uncultured Roseobacter sp.]|uniref:GlxA family transcriptional regulator n=1 Tax=uncultured Roseobacter sp. TaxID=114847 RepID=UPI0026236C0D|nr:helix-turn-helix domain-containing protein [uncultured Roseobacter sp.]
MARFETDFQPTRAIRQPLSKGNGQVSFEIFISAGFCAHEATSVTHTLAIANEVVGREMFTWRCTSDVPGLVNGSGGFMLRAAPAIDNHGFSDVMIVLGGACRSAKPWLGRARQMQRKALTIVALSDAATAYIQATNAPSGKVTTHWRDAASLRETGYHPSLTDNLAESSDGIITAAGSGSTSELLIGLISSSFETRQIAELSSRLLLPSIRKSNAAQPKSISGNNSMFNSRIAGIIELMEETISEPLCMVSLTQKVGLSTRQVERLFRDTFNQSPARFYKQLRTRQAWALVEETLLPLAEIAVVTGFGSTNTMSRAVKAEFGTSPSQARARKDPALMKFA